MAASPELRKLPSRIKGPRKVLAQLRRLMIRNARSAEHRAATMEEKIWSARVQDSLEKLIAEGEQVLPGHEDPRDRRRVRKRPLPQRMF